CFLIGGDVGRADCWRYVGTAFGTVISGRPLTRRVPEGRHTLWITGPLGGANRAAAQRHPPPQFPLRLSAAEVIRELGAACTDTSGGFFDAVWNVHQATPGARIEIDLGALPLAPGVAEFAAGVGMPAEASLLGGAGEYELFFAVPEECPDRGLARLEEGGARRIGSVAWQGPAGVFLHHGDSGPPAGTVPQAMPTFQAMTDPPPCPRAAGTVENHLREVAAMAAKLFGSLS
ncbi:hypothetical protein HQ520_05905, partial [bacterium]|nr:hypothetical protein [bacterium]